MEDPQLQSVYTTLQQQLGAIYIVSQQGCSGQILFRSRMFQRNIFRLLCGEHCRELLLQRSQCNQGQSQLFMDLWLS